MKGAKNDESDFVTRLENQLSSLEKRGNSESEQLIKLSREVARQVENLDDRTLHLQSRLETVKKLQVGIMNKVMEVIQKQNEEEEAFNLFLNKTWETMNGKIAASESKLAAMHVKREASGETPRTFKCKECGKFFRKSKDVETHIVSKHKLNRKS